MVLAPEHPLVQKITTPAQRKAVDAYVKAAATKSDLERTELAKDKTGVFTGAFAVNPVNGKKIPVWISDYILISYGTGAIMAVPAHDERDFEFAKKFGLPIVQVVSRDGTPAPARGGGSDGRGRRQLRGVRRPGHGGVQEQDHRVAGEAGHRQARGELQAARLDLLAPALLG